MSARFKLITAMLIFGSIGIFVKQINLSTPEIAFFRGIIGSVFLITTSFVIRQRLSFQSIKRNGVLLFVSGAAIGLNWIFLFQSYKYTTIANATLSYYFAPIFVMLLAPFVLKEKLTIFKVGCILTAMLGLYLTVNTGNSTNGLHNHTVGILYGLTAAVFYAGAILMNKFIKNLSGFETTLVQLSVAALVLVPYLLVKEQMQLSGVNSQSMLFILILGIIHTGIAYFFYFTALKELEGQTIAVLSYIDPISAVIFAALFLGEEMTLIQMLGGVLILSSTFMSERIDSVAQKLNHRKALNHSKASKGDAGFMNPGRKDRKG